MQKINQIYSGHKIKITNKFTNEIIICKLYEGKYCKDYANGKKLNLNDQMISFDNKYFFPINNSKFNIKIVDDIEPDVEFNEEDFVLQNNILLFRNYTFDNDNGVYRDFDITELDPEVENLVNALRSIPNLGTYGSCSGHSKHYLWVKINIRSLEALHHLLYILLNYYKDYFELTTESTLNYLDDYPTLTLKTKDNIIGKNAYLAAESLAKAIKVYINEKNLDPTMETM